LPPAKRRDIILVVSVGLCVCIYVCPSDDNFRKTWRRKFIFADTVYLDGTRVKFVYESHRVKIKVTEAKRSTTRMRAKTNLDPRNVKIPSPIRHRAVKFACSIGFSATVDQLA